MKRAPDFAITTDQDGKANIAVHRGPGRNVSDFQIERDGETTIVKISVRGDIAAVRSTYESGAAKRR